MGRRHARLPMGAPAPCGIQLRGHPATVAGWLRTRDGCAGLLSPVQSRQSRQPRVPHETDETDETGRGPFRTPNTLNRAPRPGSAALGRVRAIASCQGAARRPSQVPDRGHCRREPHAPDRVTNEMPDVASSALAGIRHGSTELAWAWPKHAGWCARPTQMTTGAGRAVGASLFTLAHFQRSAMPS